MARGDHAAPASIRFLTPYVAGRGACRHPDGATRLIASALTTFADDVRHHTQRGPCAGLRHAPLLPIPQAGARILAGVAR